MALYLFIHLYMFHSVHTVGLRELDWVEMNEI